MRTVRFFHDYGSFWPLWENGEGNYAMSPENYGLSESLTKLLEECSNLFEEYCMPIDGWNPKEKGEEYMVKMQSALECLRRELEGVAKIEDEI